MQKKLLIFVCIDFILFAAMLYVLGFGLVDERSIYLAILLGIGSTYCTYRVIVLLRQAQKSQG